MKTIKSLFTFIAGIAMIAFLGNFTANFVGLPDHSLFFTVGYAAAAFIPKGNSSVVLMAVTPDLSALAADLGTFGGVVLRKMVNTMDLEGITIIRNVTRPIIMPKLSAQGNPRPYSEGDNIGTAAAVVTDRTLTVRQSKWDYDIDPEKFRNTYLADLGFKGTFAQYILEQIGLEYASQINDSVLGTGVYDAAGTSAAAIANGFITILKAETVATTLTAKAIGAIAGTDAVTKVETFAELAPVWMQKKGFRVRCSYQTMHDYKRHYRTLNGFGFDKNEKGEYVLDGFHGNVTLVPTSWITTDGLLAHVEGALVFGTDGDNIKNASSIRRNIIENRLMMPVGCQIADLDAVMVSDVLVA